jgi:hypothetical protein
MKALLISISISAILSALPSPSHADTLQPGDVLIRRVYGIEAVHTQAGVPSGAFYVTRDGILNEAGVVDMVVTKTGRILCACWTSSTGGLGQIVEVNPTTGAQTVFATGGYIVHPGALALSADGSLLLLDFGPTPGLDQGRLVQIDPVSAGQTLLHMGDGPYYVCDLAELPGGDILLGEKNGADSGLFRWSRTTGEETKVTRDTVDVTSIVVEPQGDIYVNSAPDVGSDVCCALGRLDLSKGTLNPIMGVFEAFQMAQAPDGTLWIAAGLAFRAEHVDPTTASYLGEVNCQPDIIRSVAVWPEGVVPTRTTTWGKIKAQYR